MLTPVDLLKSDFHCSILLSGDVAPAPVTVTSLWVAPNAAGVPRSSRPARTPATVEPRVTFSPLCCTRRPAIFEFRGRRPTLWEDQKRSTSRQLLSGELR